MRKIYKVTLTMEERTELKELVSTGKSNAQKIKHANILLADKCVELNTVEQTSDETVRNVLKKTKFNRTSENAG